MPFVEAVREASRLLEERQDLLVPSHYSTEVVACDRCQPYGVFRPSEPRLIVQILGHW